MRNVWFFTTMALLAAVTAWPMARGVERVHTVEPSPMREARLQGALTVMSWNIHHGVDEAGLPSLDRIARAIRAVEADVVFLAEVDENWRRSGFVRQVEALAAMTGMEAYYFEPALTTRSPVFTRLGEVGRYGNAFLSRLPIEGKGAYSLPTSHGIEPRNLLFIDVRIGSEPVRIFGTHLSVEASERQRQFATLEGLLSGHEGAALLVGDFNTTPNRLREVAPFLFGPRWHDVHGSESEWGGTFPASRPSARIDYIFATRPMQERLLSATVLSSTASDHLAVVAHFRILGTEALTR